MPRPGPSPERGGVPHRLACGDPQTSMTPRGAVLPLPFREDDRDGGGERRSERGMQLPGGGEADGHREGATGDVRNAEDRDPGRGEAAEARAAQEAVARWREPPPLCTNCNGFAILRAWRDDGGSMVWPIPEK